MIDVNNKESSSILIFVPTLNFCWYSNKLGPSERVNMIVPNKTGSFSQNENFGQFKPKNHNLSLQNWKRIQLSRLHGKAPGKRWNKKKVGRNDCSCLQQHKKPKSLKTTSDLLGNGVVLRDLGFLCCWRQLQSFLPTFFLFHRFPGAFPCSLESWILFQFWRDKLWFFGLNWPKNHNLSLQNWKRIQLSRLHGKAPGKRWNKKKVGRNDCSCLQQHKKPKSLKTTSDLLGNGVAKDLHPKECRFFLLYTPTAPNSAPLDRITQFY